MKGKNVGIFPSDETIQNESSFNQDVSSKL